MSVNTCFQTVIGFVRSADGCVTGYDPIYSESDSGLFLNELQGLSLRILDSVNADGEVWGKMVNAREAAINTFKQDVFTEILKYNEFIRGKFTGDIGRRQFTSVINKQTYHGMRLYSDIRGGKFTLRGVTLSLNTTEAVDLYIYDEFELLHTVSGLASSAGKPRRNDITPIELDLHGDYYFIYAPVGTPYNNKLTCGCGGYRWCFDPVRPCYKLSKDKWTDWAMIGGIYGSDINSRKDWNVSHNAQGMILHGDFKCDASGMLCNDSVDFENSEIDRGMAFAIWYKTGQYMIYDIINSGEVSRWTLLGKADVLPDLYNHYSEKYSEMINFVAQNIEPERNDCMRCKSVISKTTQWL